MSGYLDQNPLGGLYPECLRSVCLISSRSHKRAFCLKPKYQMTVRATHTEYTHQSEYIQWVSNCWFEKWVITFHHFFVIRPLRMVPIGSRAIGAVCAILPGCVFFNFNTIFHFFTTIWFKSKDCFSNWLNCESQSVINPEKSSEVCIVGEEFYACPCIRSEYSVSAFR